MGLPVWNPREYEFDSYLNRIKTIVERHFAKSRSPSSMEALCWWGNWDRAMKATFTVASGYLRDGREWRRIEYMLNKLLNTIEGHPKVFSRSQVSALSFLGVANAHQPPGIPAWVDDLTRKVPIELTHTRLAELEKKVREIDKTLRERKGGPRLNEGKLSEWAEGIEGGFIYKVHTDREWKRISFMLDQMLETYRDEPQQVLDRDGGIGRYFSVEGMLQSLDKPWNRFARLEPDRPSLRPEALKARSEDRHTRKLRMRASGTTGQGGYAVQPRRALAMRKTFGDSDVYLGDTGRWRRIEYMLNELLGKIDADVTVLDRHKGGINDIGVRYSALTFLGVATAYQPCGIPAWVEDLDHNIPIGVTYTRLHEIGLKVREIEKTLRGKKGGPELREDRLSEWAEAVEGGFIYKVHVNTDWKRIVFMLDQMLRTCRDDPRQVDSSSLSLTSSRAVDRQR
ncbi:hypothetical protein JCM16303_000444 [Sporobolomyces ruberrimus]